MGQGIYSQCYNNYGQPFTGTDTNDSCMYDMGNLSSLPTGFSSSYVEEKNSGSCFFDASYFFESYALPDTPPGHCYFVIGVTSPMGYPLSVSAPWVPSQIMLGSYCAYVWTYPGSIIVTLDSFRQCNDQFCMIWTVHPWGGNAKLEAAPMPEPGALTACAEGSDYQGPPA